MGTGQENPSMTWYLEGSTNIGKKPFRQKHIIVDLNFRQIQFDRKLYHDRKTIIIDIIIVNIIKIEFPNHFSWTL